jgi:hypothetical protein
MRRGARALLLVSLAGAMMGCPAEQNPAILVNETDAPIRVRYAAPFFLIDVGKSVCPLVAQPPEVRPDGEETFGGWMPASSLEIDAEKCEASYVLEPGFISRLHYDGYCDDYEKHADQGAAFRPGIEYLFIESRGVAREWRQWDAVAQFKRSWCSSWCFVRVRES